MTEQFIKYISDNNLFSQGELILLGVSGGIDSMTLADLFRKSGFNFGIAHCNFKLRGEESDADELFVGNYARKHDIPFHAISFDTKLHAKNNGISVQMAARDLRYDWFRKLMSEYAYTKIAVAHHADDNIETFFLNLARGTGLNGLCGMPVKNNDIIRPLFFAARQEISNYALKNNIDYREDSTNAVDKYARNMVRLNIIPQLERINKAFKQTMFSNIEYLRLIQFFVENEIKKISHDICFFKLGVQYININKLKSIPYINLFLYYILKDYGFKNDIINKIATSLDAASGKQFKSHSHTIVKDRDYLIVAQNPDENNLTQYIITVDDTDMNFPIPLSFEIIKNAATLQIDKSANCAQFDFDKLAFPLILRKWRHGDSFIPYGMKGRKKLSNFFSDNKYSLIDKERQWILTSGNEIIWIVGRRIDNRFKIDHHTQHVYCIKINSV
jgi:tRNA(Ile)-lysidine synthase